MFRLLEKDEIDLRVGTCKENGISLLLYKNARVDMNILDEEYGTMGWQRKHYELKGNIYCGVSVYNEKTNQWVEKVDCGTESNTEKEKGEASDSFKRACFNIGIGRELYTSPFVWIQAKDCNIYDTKRKDKYNNIVYGCNDKFKVTEIGYNKNREINKLVIKNIKKDKQVFYMNEVIEVNKEVDNIITKEAEDIIPAKSAETLYNVLITKGFSEDDIKYTLKTRYGVETTAELTSSQYGKIVKNLEKKEEGRLV